MALVFAVLAELVDSKAPALDRIRGRGVSMPLRGPDPVGEPVGPALRLMVNAPRYYLPLRNLLDGVEQANPGLLQAIKQSFPGKGGFTELVAQARLSTRETTILLSNVLLGQTAAQAAQQWRFGREHLTPRRINQHLTLSLIHISEPTRPY